MSGTSTQAGSNVGGHLASLIWLSSLRFSNPNRDPPPGGECRSADRNSSTRRCRSSSHHSRVHCSRTDTCVRLRTMARRDRVRACTRRPVDAAPNDRDVLALQRVGNALAHGTSPCRRTTSERRAAGRTRARGQRSLRLRYRGSGSAARSPAPDRRPAGIEDALVVVGTESGSPMPGRREPGRSVTGMSSKRPDARCRRQSLLVPLGPPSGKTAPSVVVTGCRLLRVLRQHLG